MSEFISTCRRCARDSHMCPGCGKPVFHGMDACNNCRDASIGISVFNVSVGTLPDVAREIARQLHASGFSLATARQRQVLALAEECGEFVGAYRRWVGEARRCGTFDDVQAELADVVITAFVTAEELDIDLDGAISSKVEKLFARGWRDARSE